MDLIHSPRAVPARRITGDPRRWMLDGAIVGLATGYLGPAAAMFGFGLHPVLLACTAAFGVGGVLLGAMLATAIERSRGQVPLPVLGVALPVAATGFASLWAFTAAAWLQVPPDAAAIFGGVAVACHVGLFWLPYTVQAALRGPRWPIVLAACAIAPALGWLARLVFFARFFLIDPAWVLSHAL